MKTASMNSLTDTQLAQLHVKFIVPLAVGEMLAEKEPLDDVAEYTLHDLIGSLQPDTALLCLALCAQHIAAHTDFLPIGRALGAEAEKIVTEYGPLWLAHEEGQSGINDQVVRDMLTHIPEDLEAMGDLLLATCGELNDEAFAIPAILCDILGDQAHMHKEAAERQLEDMAYEGSVGALQQERGNVIAFPVGAIIRHQPG